MHRHVTFLTKSDKYCRGQFYPAQVSILRDRIRRDYEPTAASVSRLTTWARSQVNLKVNYNGWSWREA